MVVKSRDIVEALNLQAPFNLAESWDNVGLLVGNPDQDVTGILVALDPTNDLVDEAISKDVNVIITHHPVIFKPLSSIDTGEPGGQLLEKALSNRISIIGCHTNFDSAAYGVSDILAEQLGLSRLVPLLQSPDQDEVTGLGRIGVFAEHLSGEAFVNRVLQTLVLPTVQIAGNLPKKVTTVAVCGGSGSEFAQIAKKRGADIYLSAEIKHSTAIWARENSFCVIDGSHYATEKPAVSILVEKLQRVSDEVGWNIAVYPSEKEQHPFVYYGF